MIKRFYERYRKWVYTIAVIIGMYVALNIAAALTMHDGEFVITVEEIKKGCFK